MPLQVVLTDLREDWRLLWMNGSSIEFAKCNNARIAMAVISSLVKQVGETCHMLGHATWPQLYFRLMSILWGSASPSRKNTRG
jgi:hypothetical protein